jgi:hypothetical protein
MASKGRDEREKKGKKRTRVEERGEDEGELNSC